MLIDQLDAVFEPFVRVEESRHAQHGEVGLGLRIAQDPTQRIGDVVTLSDRMRRGLRAEIIVP